MERRKRIGITATIAALVAWGAATSGADDPPKAGAIVGRVVDLQGRPLAGAEVWGVEFRDEVGRVKADADGRFRLGPLKDAKAVTVWAEADGLARERRADVRVFAGEDHDIGPLPLAPGTRMKGRVVDASGKPIAGAKVGMKLYTPLLAEWTLESDAEGRFGSVPLPAGRARFLIASPGKVRSLLYRPSEPGAAESDLGDVKLEDEVPIVGVVVDQDGKPAPNVQVYADFDYENIASTDAEGRFTLGGAGKDAKSLHLESNAYFAPEPFQLGEQKAGLRLTVTRAYTILGAAVDAETGEPVAVDTVRLCMVERDPDDGAVTLVG